MSQNHNKMKWDIGKMYIKAFNSLLSFQHYRHEIRREQNKDALIVALKFLNIDP